MSSRHGLRTVAWRSIFSFKITFILRYYIITHYVLRVKHIHSNVLVNLLVMLLMLLLMLLVKSMLL
jgi:hypothetical protein